MNDYMNDPGSGAATRLTGVTTNQVDRALGAPVAERAVRLLEANEDQWFDRKSARITPVKLAPALVAFANAEGGVIAVGLSGGRLEGFDAKELRNYQQTPMDFTVPPVRSSIWSTARRTMDRPRRSCWSGSARVNEYMRPRVASASCASATSLASSGSSNVRSSSTTAARLSTTVRPAQRRSQTSTRNSSSTTRSPPGSRFRRRCSLMPDR